MLNDFITTANDNLYLNGIEFVINSKIQKLNGVVLFGLGDTLSLQWLGGFVEGEARANKFCRTCEITAEERIKNPKNVYCLRSIQIHLVQVELIKKSPDLITQYGLKIFEPSFKFTKF